MNPQTNLSFEFHLVTSECLHLCVQSSSCLQLMLFMRVTSCRCAPKQLCKNCKHIIENSEGEILTFNNTLFEFCCLTVVPFNISCLNFVILVV